MIFSCPECEKKYVLSSSKLGDEGKVVRCANCYHEWFQEPEQQAYQEPEEDIDTAEEYEEPESQAEDYDENLNEEEGFDELDERIDAFLEEDDDEPEHIEDETEETEALADEEEDQPLEDLIKEISEKGLKGPQDEEARATEDGQEMAIPKGVQPTNDESPRANQQKKKRERKSEPIVARLMGMVAAVFIFGCLFFAGIVAKPQIVAAWPPAAAIYDLAGMPVTMAGEGLVIESLEAKLSKDGRKLFLKGMILNLKDETVTIPPMRANFKITENKGKPWIIEPPQNEIAANDSIEFESMYQYPPEDVNMLNVTFDSAIQ